MIEQVTVKSVTPKMTKVQKPYLYVEFTDGRKASDFENKLGEAVGKMAEVEFTQKGDYLNMKVNRVIEGAQAPQQPSPQQPVVQAPPQERDVKSTSDADLRLKSMEIFALMVTKLSNPPIIKLEKAAEQADRIYNWAKTGKMPS